MAKLDAVGMNMSALAKKWWLWGIAYVAFWTGLALLDSVGTYMMQLTFDKPISWGLAFSRTFQEVCTFGFLTLGILWFSARVRLEPGRFPRWFFAHLGASFVFSFLYVTIVSWLWTGETSVQTGNILTFSYLFHKLALTYCVSNIFKYWIIALGFLGWQYYQRYRERERQTAALATELVQARLQALRMQINPHFLFNTLNTISALIHENPNTADKMVVRLSELLRRTLDRGEAQEVPLREEIEFLKGYLEIEQTRFGTRLEVEISVPPDVENLMVPHLILQPLVENAIRHGIEPREEPGRVEVTARRDGDRLELSVRDSGDGLASSDSARSQGGIGLSNTRSRLAHLYGSDYSFDLTNGPGGGLEARIRIPCRTTAQPFTSRVCIIPAEQCPPCEPSGSSSCDS